MLAPKNSQSTPVAVLGAGSLVSCLRRHDASANKEGTSYFFNVHREETNGQVTHSFCVDNLSDLLNLCYVLAFAIVDDGWLSFEQRTELQQLIDKLDSIRPTEADQSD